MSSVTSRNTCRWLFQSQASALLLGKPNHLTSSVFTSTEHITYDYSHSRALPASALKTKHLHDFHRVRLLCRRLRKKTNSVSMVRMGECPRTAVP
jgi:hypothetical protein